MPATLTARLDADEDFKKNLLKVCKDYIQHAKSTLDYYTPDLDAAHDILMCYSSLAKNDYIKLAKGHPRRFILPITATHIHTMTTFLTSALFGSESPWRVDAGSSGDENTVRAMNELLRWNASTQPEGIYQLGWMWIENALTYNRGVMYDRYESIFKSKWQEVEEPVLDEAGQPEIDPETQQPKTEKKVKKVKNRVGGYCRCLIVSPYDFFIDPMVPLYKMQQGRFAGHRLQVPWAELQRRSTLDPEDPMYVSPKSVENLKKKPSKGFMYPTAGTGTSGSTAEGELASRTAYERGKLGGTADARADSKDPGMVELTELWVKLVPEDYEIDERTDVEVFQIVVGNDMEVLSVSESTYEHDMFPYSVGEPRPSPFYQYSPSWVMLLKNIQDYVDYLKNRHQEAVSRTIGNVFIARADMIDIQDFEDPDKEGKFITVLPEARGMDLNQVVRQVPVVDSTANFLGEMKGFINFAESTSGATQGLQGQASGNGTATEFQSTMQMATGRLSAIARLLSVQGIVPQTKRIVSNFQQFLDMDLIRRIEGEDLLDMTDGQPNEITISQDTIQGSFDYIPHDGTLPGPDGKKVAALSRALDVAAKFPGVFQPMEGSLDPRKIILDILRAGGMKVEQYRWTPDQIVRVQQAVAQAQAQQMAQAGGPPPGPGNTPGPAPMSPEIRPAPMPSAEPPQVRPANA